MHPRMFTYFTCIRPAKAVDGEKYIIRSFISFHSSYNVVQVMGREGRRRSTYGREEKDKLLIVKLEDLL
jgi:hypothetical protein